MMICGLMCLILRLPGGDFFSFGHQVIFVNTQAEVTKGVPSCSPHLWKQGPLITLELQAVNDQPLHGLG